MPNDALWKCSRLHEEVFLIKMMPFADRIFPGKNVGLACELWFKHCNNTWCHTYKLIFTSLLDAFASSCFQDTKHIAIPQMFHDFSVHKMNGDFCLNLTKPAFMQGLCDGSGWGRKIGNDTHGSQDSTPSMSLLCSENNSHCVSDLFPNQRPRGPLWWP